ncbi:MAG: ABC transporter permease [Pseudomonadota bacterium]
MKLANLVEAFWVKLRLTLKSEAAQSYLSYTWWLLEPVLHVLVFYFVFGVMFDRGGEDFVVFLLCGQIPYLWLSRSVINASNSIVLGTGLIQQMAIPKPFFPSLVVAQDCVKQVVVFVCLFGFITLMGYLPGLTWLALPVVLFTQILLILAIAMVASAITPFLPDFRFVIGTGMLMLMFASGIFYDYRTIVLDEHRELFLLNPLARLIDAYRDVLLRGTWPDWMGLLAIVSVCLMTLWMMAWFFRRNDGVYARLVIQ